MIERKTSSYRSSQGVILLVSLILLMAMTLIGVAAIDATGLQSSMAINTQHARNLYQKSLSECEAQRDRLNNDTGVELAKINNSDKEYSSSDSMGITKQAPGVYIDDDASETYDEFDPYKQKTYIVYGGDSTPPSGYSLGIYIGKGYESNCISEVPNTSAISNQTQGLKRVAPLI